MNLPFFKFYVRDWQADPELRMCSLEARGLWIEMLCIMHSAKRRGYLETPNGQPLNDDQTSRLIGAFKGDLYRCKEELLLHSVPSVEEETGIWFCRRMVKETSKAQKCSEAAKRGGGNPVLKSEHQIPKNQIPDTRDHISIKGTFKGEESFSALTTEELLRYFKQIVDEKKIEIQKHKAVAYCEKYLVSRSDSDWVKLNGKPVKNWKNDFRTWVNGSISKDELRIKGTQ